MSVKKFLHEFKDLLKRDLVQKPGDDDVTYPQLATVVVALFHFVCGLFSIALGIGSICTLATGYFIGYGIWCGFMFLLAGLIAMLTCCRINTCMIVTNLVFSVLAACCAVVQFSLGVVAAANDYTSPRMSASVLDSVDRFDILYGSQTWRQNVCVGGSFFGSSSWGPVDILLIIVAFIELVFAVTSAAFGCKSLCCGTVQVELTRVLPIMSLNSAGELMGIDSSASYIDYSRA